MVRMKVFDQVLAVEVVPQDSVLQGQSLTPPMVRLIWSYSRNRPENDGFSLKLHVLSKTQTTCTLSDKCPKLHVPTKVHVVYFLLIHVVWRKYMYLWQDLHFARSKHAFRAFTQWSSTKLSKYMYLWMIESQSTCSLATGELSPIPSSDCDFQSTCTLRFFLQNFSKSEKMYVQKRVCQKWSKTTILCHIGVCNCISGIPPCKSVQQILCRKSLIWPIYRGLEISSKTTFFKNLIRHSSQQSPRHIANCWQRAGEK